MKEQLDNSFYQLIQVQQSGQIQLTPINQAKNSTILLDSIKQKNSIKINNIKTEDSQHNIKSNMTSVSNR